MKTRHFVIPAVLSVAGLLMLSDFAHAQRGRGASGGRGAVVGGAGRGAVVGGGYGGGYGRGFGGGGYGGAYYGYGYRGPYYGGYGWGYPFGFGLGLGIGLGGYAPIYGYAFDAYAAPGGYAYPPAAPMQAQGPPPAAPEGLPAGSASIRLLLPDPNATVFFDGNKTSQTGSERLFHTPPLAAGASSSYRIRAIARLGGKDVVLEQVVPVSPGQNITVDFTRPHSEGIAPPGAK